MGKIKIGIIGMGFIGVSHIEAIRRIGFIELVAIADTNYEIAKKKADEYGVPKCYATIEELLKDDSIDAIHNCTPTNLHTTINEAVIRSGKHIFSEKPLAMDSQESEKILKLLKQNPDVVHGINFVYRMNPLVQDMKNRVREGEIGKPYLIHGSYLQDWLLYDTDYNWRIEPEIGGASRCVADIGSHWMDCVQTIAGAKIVEVCADLVIAHPTRKKPTGQVETFSLNVAEEYEEVDVTTEDYGAVLFKMDNGIHGVFYASEVSAGRKCYLNIEVNGSRSSMCWNQEEADKMWVGYKDKDNLQVMRNPLLLTDESKKYTYLAAGHPEGWNDAMKNNVYSFYKFIADGKKSGKDACDHATFEEGHYIVKLTEAILESNKTRSWISI